MKIIKVTILSVLGVVISLSAWSATKYGDATVEQGKLIILREGRRLVYKPNDQKIVINHSDVIRLRRNTKVVLQTVEKATLTLGSNAVLHIEPWKRKEKKGTMRMLFGRFRASITGLTGAERFNVRTATATIGVKGTELRGLQTASEKTLVWVESSHTQSPVTLEGLDGIEKSVPVGFASLVVGSTPAADAVEATAELQAELESLDSPDPSSADADVLPEAATEAGLPTEDASETDSGDEADAEDLEEDADTVELDESLEDLVDDILEVATETAAEAATESFKVDVNVNFED